MSGRISRYGKGVVAPLGLTVGLGILRIVSGLAFVYACKRVIDIATGSAEGSLTMTIAGMIAAIATEILCGVTAGGVERTTAIRLQNRWRATLFQHLLSVRWKGRSDYHSGDTMNRLERDVKDLSECIASHLPSFVVALFQFGASFLFLVLLDSRLAWVLAGIVPLFLLLSKAWFKRMKRLTHQVRHSDSRIQARIQESIQHSLVIKTHHALQFVSEQLDSLQSELLHHTLTHTRYSLYSRTMVHLGFATGYTVAFVYGAFQLQEGVITYGIMTAFLQLVGQIQRPVVQLAGIVPSFINASTSADRLDHLWQQPFEEQGKARLLEGSCGVRLESVGFAYEEEGRSVIRNLSFDFSPGSRTALLGETGAGKTTLLRLILALVEPKSGRISVYNETESVAISALTRSNFIYVPQGNTLLSGTLRENLQIGNSDASSKQIERALYIAAAEFVFELPDGLDTFCGEGGGVLSEGQAQRIAIARGLLGRGSVLLLDEVTSALDAATEQLLLDRLTAASAAKTLIFITHRNEVASRCDKALHLCKTTDR